MRFGAALAAGVAAGTTVAFWLPWHRAAARLGGATGRPRLRSVVLGRALRGRGLTPWAASRRTTLPVAVRRRNAAVSWLAAGALLFLFGVPVGLVAAGIALVGVRVTLDRLEPGSVRRRRERIAADLPLSADLLAACLRAGRPPDQSLAVVAAAVGGPLGEILAEVEHRLRLGADPLDAWQRLAAEPACASLSRAVQRALTSGAALAQTLEHLAADTRHERRWHADAQARAVETRSVVPLGLCFLPAFVLIGIIPTIAGSLSNISSLLG